MNNFDDLLNNSPTEQNGGQLSKEDYAAKKQSEREDLFTLSDNTALEVSGDGNMFRQYLDVQSTFSRYSAVNALLIMAQNPEATRIAAFDFWKERGGYVKTGETGISILEPHEYTKEDGTPGTGYNVKKVFDVSQVDTRKVKAPAPAPTYTERQILTALVRGAPIAIVGVENLPENVGARRHDGRIDVQKSMGFDDTFRSLARELALVNIENREIPADNPEFSAYSTAYLLCKKYGVDTKDFSFSDAPDIFDGMDAQDVKAELTQIRDVTGEISGRMAKQLDAVTKAARNQEAR